MYADAQPAILQMHVFLQSQLSHKILPGFGNNVPVQVLELMELEVLRNCVVGLPGVNGLSVEQRKRLTIGIELVANPCKPSRITCVASHAEIHGTLRSLVGKCI